MQLPYSLRRIIDIVEHLFQRGKHDPEYITFFHYSEFYSEEFHKDRAGEVLKREYRKPTFYWFGDRYCSHNGELRKQFFYLFVKNPMKDGLEFRARHHGLGFDGLYRAYLRYRHFLRKHEYDETGILMSFSTMIPDVILEFQDAHDAICVVLKPEHAKGTLIRLFKEDGTPRIFTDIPEIVALLPHLSESLPCMKPKYRWGKYVSPNWKPMLTEKMGTWL